MSIEEPIKNLKPGDTVLVKAKVNEVKENKVNVSHGCVSHWQHADEVYLLPTTPKYDPCRPFKKGDIVTPITVNNRWLSDLWEGRAGMCFEVVKDEDSHEAYMEVEDPNCDLPYTVNVAYFELVTPAEEREPYKVKKIAPFDGNETRTQFDVVGDFDYVVASFYLDTHPHAKEAAEAERDRLNAEHRKEQQ